MKKHVIDTGPLARYSRIEKSAIRAARRLQGEIIAEADWAAQMDAGFDGGEFSGPANARRCARECDRVITQVARIFEIPDWWLENAVFVWDNVETQIYMDALMGRAA